ncbi:MAG: M16 family metallopeptidase [Thermoleophilia bacterium]
MTSIPKYNLKQLAAGGRVISEQLPFVRSISLGLWIGAGSRYEAPDEGGVSHFIEHLLFKGGKKYGAREIAEIFYSFGGELNAATSREYTVVHARFLDEHLEDALSVMADMVLHPVFAEVDQEREVVVEEIKMYEDSPSDLISDYLTESLFDGHPLGKSVLGTEAVIGSMSLEQIKDYHRGHYTLPNMVVAAAGNVDHEQLAELATSYLAEGSGSKSLGLGAAGRQAPPAMTVPGACFYEKETQQYHVSFGGIGLDRRDERRFALSILDSILGGSASSRLFQEVRDRRGLAYSVYSYTSTYADTGLVGVYFGCRKESVGEVTGIIVEQLNLIAESGVSDAELSRAKESAKGRMVLGMETTHNRMSRLGKLTVTDSEILEIDEIMARVDAVSVADVQALARDLYGPEQLVAVAIGPDASVLEEALAIMGGERQMLVRAGS